MNDLNPRVSEKDLKKIKEAAIDLGTLAMAFGRIDRTCVVHPTGEPESDTDHTVMLTWIAPALAEIINSRAGYERFSVGAVSQFAAIHDAVEVYAGDTPTHKISQEELSAKDSRERAASLRLWDEFYGRLPWFARMIRAYESQTHPCARFVRSVDKIMPKIVHVINAGTDLVAAGMSQDDFYGLFRRQRAQIVEWGGEPLLLQLYDALCQQIVASWPPSHQGLHEFVVYDSGNTTVNHPPQCFDEEAGGVTTCPFEMARKKFMHIVTVPLVAGTYPVELVGDQLVFASKES